MSANVEELVLCDVCGCTPEDAALSCRAPGDTHCLAAIIESALEGRQVDELEETLARFEAVGAQLDPNEEAIVLRADRHKWGPGRVHAYTPEEGKTRCGKRQVDCPGRVETGTQGEITCRSCLQGLEADRRRAEQQARWEQAQAEREKEDREWWARYDRYLESPAWNERRRLVLKRAGGMCEGCGKRPATQVHHLTYEHVGEELLFELVAVCGVCHEFLTQTARERRGNLYALTDRRSKCA